jgi:hypothetical protein
MAGSPALAAPTPAASGSFTANGSATLARLDVSVPANALFPGGSGFLSLVNAQHAVNSEEDQAVKARAQFIAAEALGHQAPDFPKNSVSQVAPPDNAEPATSELLAIPNNPLLWGKILPASAHARWNSDIACPTGPVEIAKSEAKVAELHALTSEGAAIPIQLPNVPALPVPAGVTVVDLPRVLASETHANIVEVAGQSGLGVASTATIDVVDLTLFKGTPAQTRIQVVSQPKLTATAAGTEGKSSVEYEAPVLKITDPQGSVHQIDAPGQSYTIGAESLPASLKGGLASALTPIGQAVPAGLPSLPALPVLSGNPYLAKLSLGVLDNKIVDANTAQGRLTMLRLELLAPDGKNPLATLALGELKAQATVADGGLTCGSPSVIPSESEGPGEELPVTGSDVTLLVAGGGLLLLLGRFAMVATARRQH